jgi:hypothetical protein
VIQFSKHNMSARRKSSMAEAQLMTIGAAREILGVSKKKMAALIADGDLATESDPLDKRVKLVRRADVEALAARSSRRTASSRRSAEA